MSPSAGAGISNGNSTCPMQGEVLEELQHHYPLNLLMTLSDAAVAAMQVAIPSVLSSLCAVGMPHPHPTCLTLGIVQPACTPFGKQAQ